MRNSSSSNLISIKAESSQISDIHASLDSKDLVIVMGAGVSVALSNGALPNWTGLISAGLAYCSKKGIISENQRERWQTNLNSDDMDELLGSAEFMARKLSAPKSDIYSRWLKEVFQKSTLKNDAVSKAIAHLKSAGIPICTLNYDPLLELATGLPPILMSDTLGVTEWIRGERNGIVHLHGFWENPESCILSIRDYQSTVGDENRDLIQRTLGTFKRLLFIGCGATFEDPNFSALVKWLRANMGAASPQHYALVKNSEVEQYHKAASWQGFVEPIGYGEDYADLPTYLLKNFTLKNATNASSKIDHQQTNDKALELYKKYLLKDCGQMTIEGVKADMDTTKQKFDLERLFVPLDVLPCAPEFPAADPDRHEKLANWLKDNNEPLPFGKVLRSTNKIALLALPGGGKTMLLKRLAVAYADPARRRLAPDQLPSDDLYPVLIRCREWRDHIHAPILTLLNNLPEITGQANLHGFADAITPSLESGSVLLLIDGLDEIHNDADRTTFVEHLEKFLDEYPKIRLVVTSREAGFTLVAPCLSRFCERYQMAPLNQEAIALLSHHWHILMTGESTESVAEGRALAQHLIESTALRRLAENPLLLTMLLVVKHGAGRLPPDRVSLYGRAVEVLLDTWNIKGHAALNLKEAIPQLACVAFEMMRQGKQTATENELLTLLEEAREKIPRIGRYAKDSPYEFLKRVELRSSLLLEAGHQLENGKTVPFYQFRHLTFQEYLAAVAAAEGHFIGYRTRDTVLDPIKSFLMSEEWKEVIPMAAVIAGKQAEPVIEALVGQGKVLALELTAGHTFFGKESWLNYPGKLPPPISRLTQCLIEEAEVSQEILPEALELVALFARACRSDDDWKALVRGPYGSELLHQAWKIYERMLPDEETWIRNTCATLGAKQKGEKYWFSGEGKAELREKVNSSNIEHIGMALLTAVGAHTNSSKPYVFLIARTSIEKMISHDSEAVWHAALWLWGLTYLHANNRWRPEIRILNIILKRWIFERQTVGRGIADFVLSTLVDLPRDYWKPELTEEQRIRVKDGLSKSDDRPSDYNQAAACVLAFHAQNIASDSVLAKVAATLTLRTRKKYRIDVMLKQLGKAGEKYLKED